MNSTIFQSNRPPLLSLDPNDLLNLLRDENFPQYPPFSQKTNKSPHKKKKSQGAIKFSDSLSESLFLSQVLHVSDQSQKEQKKKKKVVFREEIADYCSTSPQRIMPDDMQILLSKKAKKGILMKKHSISIYDILWDKNTNEAQNNSRDEVQQDNNETNISDIKVATVEEEQTEPTNNQSRSLNIPLETIDLENEPLDTSSDSLVEDEARNKAFAGSTPKASNKKGINKPQDMPLATPFNTNLEKGISLSEVIPTAILPDPRKNQSSIAGSLNDLPLNSTPNSMAGSENSLNEIDLKLRAGSQNELEGLQRPSPRVRVVKYRESPSLSVEISNGISEKLMTKGANRTGLSSFAPSQTFLNDLKVQNRPVINTQNALTAALNKGFSNQNINKSDNLMKNLNHHSGKAFSMTNLETKKIQTAANNHIVIKTNATPKTRSKALLPLEIPQNFTEPSLIQSDRESTKKTNFHINSSLTNIMSQERSIMSDAFCLKDGNKVIWYSLKDKNYKVKELDPSLGLEGCAFCQINDDSILISGGIESKNPTSKLVSSKVSRLNIYGEKETLQGMPIARYNHSLVALGKNVYALGGQSFDGKVLKSCYLFDLEKNSWFRIPSMKYERINPVSFASIKTGSIYVIGGTDSEGNEIPWIEKFDNKKGSWQLVYNTSRLNFNTKDSTLVLGTVRNCEKENDNLSEEVLMLVRNNIVKNGLCKYSLFSFDTDKEILQKKSNFQYEVSESQVMGFLYNENLYLAEKDCYTIMDVYLMNKQTWNQVKFAQNN